MTILMAIRDLALLCVRVCRCGVVSLSKKNLLTLLQSSRLLNGNLVAWCQVPTGEAAHPMPGNNWVSKCSTVLLSFSSVRLLYVAALTGLLPPSVYTNTGMPGTTQSLEPCAANLPGAELVTRRRTVQFS